MDYKKDSAVVHGLKCEDNYLNTSNHEQQRLILGLKTAEIRYNDRDFQLGDFICFSISERLQEILGVKAEQVMFEITHVHSGLGLQPGYVMLSLGPKIMGGI